MLSELPRDFALVALLIAVALTGVLFMYALGLRIANVLHRREEQRLRRKWRPVFAAAALRSYEPAGRQPTWPKPRSRAKVLREWCRFRTNIRGACCSELDRLAGSLGLLTVARKLLKKRSVSQQLLAVCALGQLGDAPSWGPISRLVDDRHVSLSVMAATALVMIHPAKAVSFLMPRIAQNRNWPRTQVGRMLKTAGPDAVSDELCHAIQKADDETATYLLQFFESAHVHRIDSVAAELLISRSDPGVLAAALKTIRGHLPAPIIERCARHKTWFVRMQAANVLGRFGRREDYALLEPLLSDREWWVRYRAAQAITRLPFLGPNALRKLRDRQADRYAREIMVQALAEAGLQ